MEFTVIIMGRFEFKNTRSILKAKEVIEHLMETRYKKESLYKDIEVFDEERLTFIAPRQKFLCTDKVWQNTVHLFEQTAQFAIAGDVRLWKIHPEKGTLQQYERVEPRSDKTVIKAYMKGRRLLGEEKYMEAQEAFSDTIKRFDRHAMAMECRAYTHYVLGDIDDALTDYAASIAIDNKRPEAFLGRGIIFMKQHKWADAISDLTTAMKRSMPHHDVYLEALHRKGQCEMEVGEFDKAIASFNFFLSRPLLENHPQFPFRRQVSFDKGRALAAKAEHKDSIGYFNAALKMPGKNGLPTKAEILLHRGLASQQNGQKGFLNDWKEAANEGSKRAAELLAAEG